MRYYIAYGSNLSVWQMEQRCRDARIAGIAMLKDWKLVFRLFATIEPSPGDTVPVLIWEISDMDEESLDRYEGYPHFYYKKELAVTMTDLDGRNPQEITAMVYIMADGTEIGVPAKFYYMILDEGYTRFGFDKDILTNALFDAKEAEHGISR